MKLSRPLKFCIGLFAGLCASLFPRLVAELATPDTGDTFILFSQSYLLLSLVFSIFIGAVITIFEWETTRSPKDIFMSALAVPAILSGALNTTATVNNIKQLNVKNSEYQQTIQSLMQIPSLPPTTISPLTNNTPYTPSAIRFSLVAEAYAGTAKGQPASTYNFGVVQVQPDYLVVLDQASSQQEAEQKAAVIQQQTPVKIVKGGNNNYLIVTKRGKQNKAQALSEAIQLKTQRGLQPSLQEIR